VEEKDAVSSTKELEMALLNKKEANSGNETIKPKESKAQKSFLEQVYDYMNPPLVAVIVAICVALIPPLKVESHNFLKF